MIRELVVQAGSDVGIVHVVCVVPCEASIDEGGTQIFAVHQLNSCFHAQITHSNGVLGDSAGQDLHQGGFAGAVFANQSVYLSGTQAEADIIQRTDTREILANACMQGADLSTGEDRQAGSALRRKNAPCLPRAHKSSFFQPFLCSSVKDICA